MSDPWCSSLEVKVFLLASQIKLLRDHPYITSAKGLGGWVKKIAVFADVQYCIYADMEIEITEVVRMFNLIT